jgi:hypothetical protein
MIPTGAATVEVRSGSASVIRHGTAHSIDLG